jgi:hypothetical protein
MCRLISPSLIRQDWTCSASNFTLLRLELTVYGFLYQTAVAGGTRDVLFTVSQNSPRTILGQLAYW